VELNLEGGRGATYLETICVFKKKSTPHKSKHEHDFDSSDSQSSDGQAKTDYSDS
jgi:hypothetical protein